MKTKLLILTACVALASCTPSGNKYTGPKIKSPILIPGKDNSTEGYDNSVKTVTVVSIPPPPVEKAAATVAASPSPESIANGKSLISKSDCLGCHKLDTRLVGPGYQEVAKKYTLADATALENKIIHGGAGNWGEIPMSPHPSLSMRDAKDMVSYILSLK